MRGAVLKYCVVASLLTCLLFAWRNFGGGALQAEWRMPHWKPGHGAQIADVTPATEPPMTPPAVVAERRKVVVMAKTSDEDTNWAVEDLPDWDKAVYVVNDTTAPLHTAQNKGREANAYLTYLIDNYHNLHDVIVFLHAHRGGWPKAWHIDNTEYSNVLAVQTLQLDFIKKNGYANLRCIGQPGCPGMFKPYAEDMTHSPYLKAYISNWNALHGDVPLPESIGAACCGQFAVSKERVLKRPKSDYERYHKWLMETELDDHMSGTVLEYTWHIVFGMEADYCPELGRCYCDVYGRCGGGMAGLG